MQIREISATSPETLEAILRSIPFYKAVKQQSQEQFDALMSLSQIAYYNSGEQILKRGDFDTWTYFVVKGQLVVAAPDNDGLDHRVNYITPGEVFGDISVYLKTTRTADVFVDNNCRQAVVFATDFGIFGDLSDFTVVSLDTKLLYYRHATHNLRWKLEMYRSRYRQHKLADEHRKIKLYSGEKGSVEELSALSDQATALAKLIVKWNQNFGNLSFSDGVVPAPDLDI